MRIRNLLFLLAAALRRDVDLERGDRRANVLVPLFDDVHRARARAEHARHGEEKVPVVDRSRQARAREQRP